MLCRSSLAKHNVTQGLRPGTFAKHIVTQGLRPGTFAKHGVAQGLRPRTRVLPKASGPEPGCCPSFRLPDSQTRHAPLQLGGCRAPAPPLSLGSSESSTEAHEFRWLRDVHGPKRYKSIWSCDIIGRPAGRRPAGGPISVIIFPVALRPKSGPEGRFPARKH
jgi:hypothetical protein